VDINGLVRRQPDIGQPGRLGRSEITIHQINVNPASERQ
jgi:hypothetical protein